MTDVPVRRLAPGQRCRVRILDVDSGSVRTVHEGDDLLLEAPNWSADDRLILNGDGALWELDPVGTTPPRRIRIDGIPDLNNDHVLGPDGETIYLSANDWQLYRAPLSGGLAERITSPDDGRLHFLHGVSPDGSRLAYVGLVPDGDDWWASANIHTVSTWGGEDRQLTFGGAPADGCEYSPDGAWIYFNTEVFSTTPGHAQIARMRVDGSELEQLTDDERVNWFPHPAPVGDLAVYLSFPPGTTGHPADLPIDLRLVRDGAWRTPEVVVTTFGGQGTLNVNSWSPDGRRLAFVDYPIPPEGTP